ncbi:MAG TPA: hypothetical protein VEQ60_12430 [Longimicrobium sp.]|nr:hypothetical protein [Longimicrobium sp.]
MKQETTTMGMLLSYAVTTDPDPLQASPADGAVSTGALTIVVSNNIDDAIYCNQIVFGIPEGTLAQQLTNDDTSLQCAITPDTWSITANGGGTFTATPVNPSGNEITDRGLVVEIFDIQVNQEPGTASISIVETSSNDPNGPFDTSDGTLTVAKFPYGFFFDNFAPSAVQIDDGGSVTLTWNGSDGPIYTLLWGSQAVDVTEVRSYTVGPLNADTTFLLQATYQSQGATATTSLTTSVNVGNPDLTLSTLTVTGDATVNGVLAAGTVNVTTLAANDATVAGTLKGADFGTVDLGAGASVSGGPLTVLGAMAALGAPQPLTLTSDGTGGTTFQNNSGTFIASTDGLVVGSIYQTSPLVAPPCNGTITAGNSSVFVQASLGPPVGDVIPNQWFYGAGSLLLPVRRNDTFGVSSSTPLNNTADPTIAFFFIPFGSGGVTATDSDN